MAAPKFYRVLRGERGAAAKEKFLNYLQGLTAVPKTGTAKNRPAKTMLYVEPFNVSLGVGSVLQVSANTPSWTALETALASYTKTTLPNGTSGIILRNARASRVSAVSGRSASGEYSQSKLTGLNYIKYAGTGISAPFGKSASGDTEETVFQAIKTALAAAGLKSIHLIQEKI